MPLKSLVKKIKSHQDHSPVLVVFDLDSTVFDVSPRTEHILKEFANNEEFQKKYPRQTSALRHVKVESTDWGIKQALSRLKLEGTIDFFEELREFWVQHFFSNDFLHLDRPYEGVVDYIKHLEDLGARIMYLTGRDTHRMGDGSLKVLQEHGLPVDENHHKLILKPQKGMSDSKFKRDVFLDLVKEHTEIWFFENEPVNLNLIEKELPDIKLVFIDSVHSNREPTPEHLPTVGMKFYIEEE